MVGPGTPAFFGGTQTPRTEKPESNFGLRQNPHPRTGVGEMHTPRCPLTPRPRARAHTRTHAHRRKLRTHDLTCCVGRCVHGLRHDALTHAHTRLRGKRVLSYAESDLSYAKSDLSIIRLTHAHTRLRAKRVLSYAKRDLSYAKRDLSYAKRDLLHHSPHTRAHADTHARAHVRTRTWHFCWSLVCVCRCVCV